MHTGATASGTAAAVTNTPTVVKYNKQLIYIVNLAPALMPIEVHSESLKRRYIASWCSFACLINLLILVGAGVFPVYICWSTGLWQVQVVRWEQPSLNYNSVFLVQLSGFKGPAGGYRAPFIAAYSSSAAANDLIGTEALRGMVVRSSVSDTNYDAVTDIFHFSAMLPLQPDETVHSVSLITFHTTSLVVRNERTRCKQTSTESLSRTFTPPPPPPSPLYPLLVYNTSRI